jgi:MFS family permease
MALGQLVFVELNPPSKYPVYIAIIAAVLTSSLVCGPLIGGGITLHGDWRWVFLIKYAPYNFYAPLHETNAFTSVPIGAVTLAMFVWIFPQWLSKEPAGKQGKLSFRMLHRDDFLGCILLLGH